MVIDLIDARRGLHDKCLELFADKKIAEQIYRYLCDGIEDCPPVEPSIYGYRLEHLAFVATILQNKGVTEENLTDVLNCVDCIVGMVLEEAKEKTMQLIIK